MKTKTFMLALCAGAMVLVSCGNKDEVSMEQTIDQLETVFDAPAPEATPDRPAPPPQARKELQEQVKEASNYMRQEKYDQAMGVLNSVRRNQYITADQKPYIDQAMRQSQKSLARLKAQGGLSAAEEARIRKELSR
jgi:hypothetical protein